MGRAELEYKRKKAGTKLSDGKTVGRSKHLMLVMMDRIHNYYGLAVHNNHDLKSIQNAIWAIYHHVIKDNNLASDEQHKICPSSADSWCKYWIDTNNRYKNLFRRDFQLILKKN